MELKNEIRDGKSVQILKVSELIKELEKNKEFQEYIDNKIALFIDERLKNTQIEIILE